jgi:hypothetical protein
LHFLLYFTLTPERDINILEKQAKALCQLRFLQDAVSPKKPFLKNQVEFADEKLNK